MIRVLLDVTLCGWVSHYVSNERSAFIFNRNVGNYARKTASCPKRPDSGGFHFTTPPRARELPTQPLIQWGRLPRDRKNYHVSIMPYLRMHGAVIIIIIIIIVVVIIIL